VLFNEPKLLKSDARQTGDPITRPLSVLFNEPKLLKLNDHDPAYAQ